MKASFFRAAGLGLAFASQLLAQQPPVSDTAAAKIEKRAPALAALRKGDYTTADALFQALATGNRNSSSWHLSYAEQLMAAAIDLKDRDSLERSTEYFHRAATELTASLAATDAPTQAAAKAKIYHQLGFIAWLADGDQAKANGYYMQALTADPTSTAARAALQRTKEGRKMLETSTPPTDAKPAGK